MAMTDVRTELPEAARRFLDGKPKQLFIDGKWVDAADGRTFDTIDPATEQVLAKIAFAGKEDVDRAVTAARTAFEDGRWRDIPPRKKETILRRLADLIEANADELGLLETLDNGKPLRMATGEMRGCAETFRYYAGWPTKITGDVLPTDPGKHSYVRREPVGVCGQIIPWNFPLAMASWKVAPALACGNTCVLKPAEQTPLTALRLAELAIEAGVPEGVLNVVTGDGTTGAFIVEHPDVDKIAFTGSVEVGRQIMAAAAGTLKKVSLELGGKSPNIVFADADMETAVRTASLGVFMNTGQICTAATRLFLEDSIHDDFVGRMSEFTKGLKVGPGLDEGVLIGPVVSDEQLERVTGYIDIGKEEGAEAALGGKRIDRAGYFVEPTIFTGVRNDMRIAQEEIFGPVVSVIPFTDVEDAVTQGNDTQYGLAAAVWTRDISKAHRAAAALKAGSVWVNCYSEGDMSTPFGGYKQSGFGRERGEASLDLYTQLKSVVVKL
jgi:acyl-CoA reductase-like NAD-dependent aldehyde dehydrogenase